VLGRLGFDVLGLQRDKDADTGGDFQMNGRIALVLLLGVSFLFFGCAQPQTPEQPVVPPVTPPTGGDEPIVGGDKDEHGCIGSAGYTWCEAKQKCVRIWEEPCVAGSLTLDEAKAVAEKSPCMDEGKLGDTHTYNEVTNTWWFDMDIDKPGCSPACVVYANETAEINWRCTGAIPPEEPEETVPEENETVEEPTSGSDVSEEQLADLFQIEGEEPIGDEGLDTGTPSSNSS